MGRHICSHTYGDTRCAVDKEVRYAGGEHYRLLARVVVVWLEINSVGVDIRQHLFSYMLKAYLGVTHCGGAVAVDRAEVTVAVDKGIA